MNLFKVNISVWSGDTQIHLHQKESDPWHQQTR